MRIVLDIEEDAPPIKIRIRNEFGSVFVGGCACEEKKEMSDIPTKESRIDRLEKRIIALEHDCEGHTNKFEVVCKEVEAACKELKTVCELSDVAQKIINDLTCRLKLVECEVYGDGPPLE